MEVIILPRDLKMLFEQSPDGWERDTSMSREKTLSRVDSWCKGPAVVGTQLCIQERWPV